MAFFDGHKLTTLIKYNSFKSIMKTQNKFIINKFNRVYMMVVICGLLFVTLFNLYLFKLDFDLKILAIRYLYTFNAIYFFIYKYFIFKDETFYQSQFNCEFNWYNELPLELCNIILFGTLIFTFTLNKYLLIFIFYYSFIAGAISFSMPMEGFLNRSIFDKITFGYFYTHTMVFLSGITMFIQKIYVPSINDIPYIFLMSFVLMLVLSEVSRFLRKYKFNEVANYCFSYYHGDYEVLKKVYGVFNNRIGYDLLMSLIFSIVSLIIYFVLVLL